MDVKTEYTHAGCGHESMLNPLVHCAAKEESNVSEAVRPCCKEIEKHTCRPLGWIVDGRS